MSRNDDEDDELATGDSLVALERLARLMRQASHAYGLNPAQWEALRYVARANALSNSPGALARYLGATKGTISQTVLALEKKGLITKQSRNQDARSITLALTEKGVKLLAEDQMVHLRGQIEALGRKTRRRFDKALAELLEAEVARQQEPSFGTCLTCRSFRASKGGGPALCLKVNATLTEDDLTRLCIEHTAPA